ncbi:hypothetical protein DL98DRAFT_515134 [Cadophora sp. DSE1049]|nr:hypothetical protein DL98DRAFT_515134 [Cadophora sp. DSE1049]
MLAPELLLAKAWQDLTVAHSDLPLLQRFSRIDEVEWTLTHSLFADMGGFVIRGNTGQEATALGKSAIDFNLAAPATLGDNNRVQAQGEEGDGDNETQFASKSKSGGMPDDTNNITRVPEHVDPFHLTAAGILHLRSLRLLPMLPSVTVEELNDKSKSDAFSRLVSLVQIIWIVIQVIARSVQGLSVSQLEITVVAFSACAVVIYALGWKKTKGAAIPYTLLSYPGEISAEIIRAACQNGPNEPLMNPMLSTLFDLDNSAPAKVYGSPIPNDTSATRATGQDDPYQSLIGLILGSSIFGGIHCAAWNFSFPTGVERLLWRVTSCYCVAYIFIWYGLFVSSTLLGAPWFRRWSVRAAASLYVLARFYLLVEVFRALAFLPPDAYTSTWSSSIPHVG